MNPRSNMRWLLPLWVVGALCLAWAFAEEKTTVGSAPKPAASTQKPDSVSPSFAAELPEAKPVPAVQVLPLPYDQASFQYQGRELTRYHFGPTLRRPFLYPVSGPEGRSLTRMGHPRDPFGHSHHNSIWISHTDVGGVNFWADRDKTPPGRIVCERIEQYEDGPKSAWLLAINAWQDAQGKTILLERRRIEVQVVDADHWWILIDLQLEPPGQAPVLIGQNPFGIIGVRMAKTIGVADGGGRLLNSEGQRGEPAMFRKPARWVDYSGPITLETPAGPSEPSASGGESRSKGPEPFAGITLMDHPSNPSHPTPFHVRADGWMGASLTLAKPITIQPGQPLRLRYGLWIHPGVPSQEQVENQWQEFSKTSLPPLTR